MVEYTTRLLKEWKPEEIRDINSDMARLTLSIVSKTLFNADIERDASQIGKALTVLLDITNDRVQSPIQVIPDWIPTPNNRKRKEAVQALDAIITDIINRRRASNVDQGDLLSMLMMATDDDGKQMTDRQLRDEAVTLVLAGHETTANALAWTWYLLSEHPQVEAKLHEELAQVLGGRLPTIDDLPKLVYADMVIKESMRLYPPIPEIARQPIDDIMIGDYLVPKGTIIIISQHVIHRDPRWYANPDSFQPERFSEENEKLLPKGAYLPFASGPRVCIGNTFATMEAVLILATVAQQHSLRLLPNQQIVPQSILTLRPQQPIQMMATLTSEGVRS